MFFIKNILTLSNSQTIAQQNLKELNMSNSCFDKVIAVKKEWMEKVIGGEKQLEYAMLTNTKLIGFDFSNADLSGSDFSHTDLRFANFSGACLVHANFQGANLESANFTGADLRN